MALEYLKQLGKAREDVKTVADTAVGKIAQAFAQQAVDQKKDEVPTSQPGTGALKQSIGVQFKAEDKVLSIEFLAEDYWDFVNSGVDGVQEGSGSIINQFGDTYSFKTLNPSKKMVDAFAGEGSMQNWLAAKGITSLTFGGETHQLTTDADFRGAAYVFARAVKRHGIKPTPFVNNALSEKNLEAFEQKLLDAFETMI